MKNKLFFKVKKKTQCPTPNSLKYLIFLQAPNSSHASFPVYNVSSPLIKTYPNFIAHIQFNLFFKVFSDLFDIYHTLASILNHSYKYHSFHSQIIMSWRTGTIYSSLETQKCSPSFIFHSTQSQC